MLQIIILTVICVTTSFAQSSFIQKDMKYYLEVCEDYKAETAYFTIAHDNRNLDDMETVLEYSDDILEQLLKIYGINGGDDFLEFIATRLINENGKPLIVVGAPTGLAGTRVDYRSYASEENVVLKEDSPFFMNTLIHEISHTVFFRYERNNTKPKGIIESAVEDAMASKVPSKYVRAFNEGIAQIFEHHEIDSSGAFNFKLLDAKYSDYWVEYIQKRKRGLVGYDAGSIVEISRQHLCDYEDTVQTYQFSESILLYLIAIYGHDAFYEFLKSTLIGNMNIFQAIYNSCGVTIMEFESGWLTWVKDTG